MKKSDLNALNKTLKKDHFLERHLNRDNACYEKDRQGLNKALNKKHMLFGEPDKNGKEENVKQDNKEFKKDPKIEALNLAEPAKSAAYALKAKFPKMIFSSGRRGHAEQARAMTKHVMSNKKWIEKTYFPKLQAYLAWQDWINNNLVDGKIKFKEKEIRDNLKMILTALIKHSSNKKGPEKCLKRMFPEIEIVAHKVISDHLWIEKNEQKSYKKRKALWISCQVAVDSKVIDGKLTATKQEINDSLFAILNASGDKNQSAHFYGYAFDMIPDPQNYEQIEKTIISLPGYKIFFPEEGGENIWHAEYSPSKLKPKK